MARRELRLLLVKCDALIPKSSKFDQFWSTVKSKTRSLSGESNKLSKLIDGSLNIRIKQEHVDEEYNITRYTSASVMLPKEMTTIEIKIEKDVLNGCIFESQIQVDKQDLRKSFVCSVCGKIFYHGHNYRVHMKMHYGIRSHQCDQCDRKFAQSGHLTIHKRISHTNIRPFKCDLCDKAFAVKQYLITHRRTHTNERPFKCPLCPKRFTQKNHMATHKRRHTNERRYECDVCQKTFVTKETMVTHSRIHCNIRPYQCKYCNKSFHQPSPLVSHTRTHTGVRPYKCTVCSKAYCTKPALTAHLTVHAAIKPFPCNACDVRFSHKSTLRTHKRNVHDISC
ncbi:zinc finger protein 32-like [Adelges cooleyi]|uniref:zinc finger protein 32-like n=1 Tax=Adelges cooleyi TaxID=133065 RepID=UPI00217F24CD|nr:zinc finger protein 32-like [Adelges cooleyi]XP_050427500.1 zinc finger protein 32-like [Adelges cooleyi]XP_050427501.1 zinc finger protein 32-like [Adelges cooleyi]